MNTILILHNIRSLHNVGAIFRTADGVGVSKIYLTGYTPAPFDLFGKLRKDFAKTALGAEKSISWEKIKSISILIQRLKKEKYFITALEQSTRAIDLFQFSKALPQHFKKYSGLALIVGNEVRGVSPATLKLCDVILEIPMKGKKESLNVSVATGIALYSLVFHE